MTLVTIPVTDIREGDILPGPHGWTAAQDAEERGTVCECIVWSTADGGSMRRVWEDPTHTLEVERPG